jgi:hypothetical protein
MWPGFCSPSPYSSVVKRILLVYRNIFTLKCCTVQQLITSQNHEIAGMCNLCEINSPRAFIVLLQTKRKHTTVMRTIFVITPDHNLQQPVTIRMTFAYFVVFPPPLDCLTFGDSIGMILTSTSKGTTESSDNERHRVTWCLKTAKRAIHYLSDLHHFGFQ